MLIDGKWTEEWQPVQATDAKGGFVRQTSSFRHWVTPDGAPGPTGRGGFKAEAGRYHLYAALICPWASRALIARKLKRLESAVSVSIVEPRMTEQGWRFGSYPGADLDTVNGAAVPSRALLPRRSALHGPRNRARALGPRHRHHRQQRVRGHLAHVQLGLWELG